MKLLKQFQSFWPLKKSLLPSSAPSKTDEGEPEREKADPLDSDGKVLANHEKRLIRLELQTEELRLLLLDHNNKRNPQKISPLGRKLVGRW